MRPPSWWPWGHVDPDPDPATAEQVEGADKALAEAQARLEVTNQEARDQLTKAAILNRLTVENHIVPHVNEIFRRYHA